MEDWKTSPRTTLTKPVYVEHATNAGGTTMCLGLAKARQNRIVGCTATPPGNCVLYVDNNEDAQSPRRRAWESASGSSWSAPSINSSAVASGFAALNDSCGLAFNEPFKRSSNGVRVSFSRSIGQPRAPFWESFFSVLLLGPTRNFSFFHADDCVPNPTNVSGRRYICRETCPYWACTARADEYLMKHLLPPDMLLDSSGAPPCNSTTLASALSALHRFDIVLNLKERPEWSAAIAKRALGFDPDAVLSPRRRNRTLAERTRLSAEYRALNPCDARLLEAADQKMRSTLEGWGHSTRPVEKADGMRRHVARRPRKALEAPARQQQQPQQSQQQQRREHHEQEREQLKAAASPAVWVSSPSSVPHLLLARALDRTTLPLGADPFRRVMLRLLTEQPITVTAVGQSNTVRGGGCFGRGCIHSTTMADVVGWGHTFMRLINLTWPHPGHALYNRAYGASSPKAIATCLSSHMAAGTDILLVDFDTMHWQKEEQERLARTAALAHPAPPLVIFVGFPNWCSTFRKLPVVRRANESQARAVHRTRDAAVELCATMLREGMNVSRVDEVGDSLAPIAKHYSQLYVSMHDLLTPLIQSQHRSFFPPIRFTADGAHGQPNGYARQSAYYDAAGAALYHLLCAAASAVQTTVEHGALPSHEDLWPGKPQSGKPQPGMPRLPPLRSRSAGEHYMLSCHEWLHPNLVAPLVALNESGVLGAPGWVVSEYTHQATPRRKPGLLSFAVDDVVELELGIRHPLVQSLASDQRSTGSGEGTGGGSGSDGEGNRSDIVDESSLRGGSGIGSSGLRVCLGVTYLKSYTGMGAIDVSCIGACACAPATIDALDPLAHASLFHTWELPATMRAAVPRVGCRLRLRNRPRLVSPPPPPPAAGLRHGVRSVGRLSAASATTESALGASDGHQFRLSGVYVRWDEPPCEVDLGAKPGQSWWRAAINRVPVANGLEPARRR